ncbi:hypothetical protein O3M35_006603 [Rhynocoris fuscipes]|uniref:Cytochrome P450 n=1 Tax=Rhynocoris fuscipes TaxID=488301 RepID=A0AAW1DEC2_9HEMI
MLPEVLCIAFGIIVLIRWIIYRKYNYWQRRGIECVTATFPYGSLEKCFLIEKTIGETLAEFYRNTNGKQLVGFYSPFEPMLLIKDPELIKLILVKEFNNFHDNGFVMSKDVDPLLGNNPFSIRGLQEWKHVRGIHTPTQSLARIKNFIPNLAKVAENFVKYLCNKNGEPVEMKTTSRYFTVDSVAICAFGIESDSFFDGNSSLKEYTNGELFGTSSEGNCACLSALFLPPIIDKIFRWRTMSKKVERFFIEMVKTIINHRKNNCIERNDLIQHLMVLDDKANLEQSKRFTDSELAAHCMTFFIDGVETSSSFLTFTLFEIAANIDIQNKLRNEIKSIIKDENVINMDYDKLCSLNYLDSVLSESLRKYPLVNFLSRICIRETTINGLNIQPGIKLFIPTLGLHMDPEYYPQPEKFLPERFSNENRTKLNKFVYLPFGEGPRICLGYKFALTQVKMAIVTLLLNFHLDLPAEDKGKTSLEFDANSLFLVTAKGDVNIVFKSIK